AAGSPCSIAFRIRVTSLMSSSITVAGVTGQHRGVSPREVTGGPAAIMTRTGRRPVPETLGETDSRRCAWQRVRQRVASNGCRGSWEGGQMSSPNTIEHFIRRIRAGDEQAALELVRSFEPLIRRQIRLQLEAKRLSRLFDSLDVCQSVLKSFFFRTAA